VSNILTFPAKQVWQSLFRQKRKKNEQSRLRQNQSKIPKSLSNHDCRFGMAIAYRLSGAQKLPEIKIIEGEYNE